MNKKNNIIHFNEIEKASNKEKSIKNNEEKNEIFLKEKCDIEIEQYKNIINSFIKDLSKLAIIDDVIMHSFTRQINNLCVNEVLYNVIIPILQDRRDMLKFIDEATFSKIRDSIKDNLKNKYITK